MRTIFGTQLLSVFFAMFYSRGWHDWIISWDDFYRACWWPVHDRRRSITGGNVHICVHKPWNNGFHWQINYAKHEYMNIIIPPSPLIDPPRPLLDLQCMCIKKWTFQIQISYNVLYIVIWQHRLLRINNPQKQN